jgi:Leucine-rich repeat (LRR) protein
MLFKVRYPNDDTEYKVYIFAKIRDDCIYLDCSDNNLTSLKPVKKLKQLQILKCDGNNITSLEPVRHLKQLQRLDCSGNKITSLEPIKDLTQLQYLHCSYNQLTSLQPIKHLTQLRKIFCAANYIKSLEGIENLTQLQSLSCYSNQLTSLEGIENLIQLEKFWCMYNKLTSIKEIENLTQLNELNVSNNKLISLEGIENLTQLEQFLCCYNEIISLPLEIINFRNLNYILYHGNPIDNTPIQVMRFINRIRQGELNNVNVYNDSQNIHNSSIQESVFDSIKRLTEKVNVEFNLEQLTAEILEDTVLNCKERILEYMSNTDIHSLLLLNFSEILWLVWNVIKSFDSETQVEIKKRLDEEVEEAVCMCYTGRCNRLINCLNGFSDLVEIKIQDSSQIGNVIVVVKERLAGEERYTIEEHKKIVKKELLERGYELDVINEWLEYIE